MKKVLMQNKVTLLMFVLLAIVAPIVLGQWINRNQHYVVWSECLDGIKYHILIPKKENGEPAAITRADDRNGNPISCNTK